MSRFGGTRSSISLVTAAAVAVLVAGCGGSSTSGPSPATAVRRAISRTLAAPSFTALLRSGGQHDVASPLIGVGIYQAPDRWELVRRLARSGPPLRRLSIRFAIGNKLYALSRSGITPVAPGNRPVAAVSDPRPAIRAMVEIPPQAFPASWTRHGDEFTGTATARGATTHWTAVLSHGLISSITESTRRGTLLTTTTTTVFGVGVSAVPTPDRAAADEAEALLASE